MCEASLPNKEISLVYKKEIIIRFASQAKEMLRRGILESPYLGDAVKPQECLASFLVMRKPL